MDGNKKKKYKEKRERALWGKWRRTGDILRGMEGIQDKWDQWTNYQFRACIWKKDPECDVQRGDASFRSEDRCKLIEEIVSFSLKQNLSPETMNWNKQNKPKPLFQSFTLQLSLSKYLMVLHKNLINMTLDCFSPLQKSALQFTWALNQGHLDVTFHHNLVQW